MAVFVISLVVGSYFSIRASFNRRPGPSKRWFVNANHLNAVLLKDKLTPEGQKFRTSAFRALLVAFISFAALEVASAFLAPY